jgi:uncharacterized protein (DUF1778 family)
MPKRNSEYPEALRVRLTVEQDTFLREAAEIGGVKPSDLVRALIENARVNRRVDEAIAVIDRTLEEVGDVGGN